MQDISGSSLSAAHAFLTDFAPRLAHLPRTSAALTFIASILDRAKVYVLSTEAAIFDASPKDRLAAYQSFRLPAPIVAIEFTPAGDSHTIDRFIGIAWSATIENALTPEISVPEGYKPSDGFFAATLMKMKDPAKPFYLDVCFGFVPYHVPANPSAHSTPMTIFPGLPELANMASKAQWNTRQEATRDFISMTHEALIMSAASNVRAGHPVPA